jgi:hypothetical protein
MVMNSEEGGGFTVFYHWNRVWVLTYSGSQLTRTGQERGKQEENKAYQYNSHGQIPGNTVRYPVLVCCKDRRQLEQAAGGGKNFPKRRDVQEPTEKTSVVDPE